MVTLSLQPPFLSGMTFKIPHVLSGKQQPPHGRNRILDLFRQDQWSCPVLIVAWPGFRDRSAPARHHVSAARVIPAMISRGICALLTGRIPSRTGNFPIFFLDFFRLWHVFPPVTMCSAELDTVYVQSCSESWTGLCLRRERIEGQMNDKKYGLIILLPGMQGDWGG